VLVKIDINKLKSGRVQISLRRIELSAGHAQTYPSPVEAKAVLLGLGMPDATVDEKLEVLSGVGSKELLHVGQFNIADDVLSVHRFHP